MKGSYFSPKKSRNPDFFLSSFPPLFLFFVPELVLKLLEIVTKPSLVSSFSPLLLCVCQWAKLPVCPLSLLLRVWMQERCVASPLSSHVWLPLSLGPHLSLLLPLSAAFPWSSGVSERWLNLVFLSPYLSATAAPQMSSSNWMSIKTTWLWRACCTHTHPCTCVCRSVCPHVNVDL